MKRGLGLVLVAAAMGVGKVATGEEACKSVQLKNPALTLSEMYTMSEKYAKAWKKDAVPAGIGNTTLGPLQPNGSSLAWNLKFYSEEAKSYVVVNTFRGSLTCWADKGSAGRIPNLKPDFFRDGAKLYEVGRQNGEALLKDGYFIMLATSAAPSDRHAMWYINYSKDRGKDASVTVILNANTGAVERVIKH